MGLMMTRDEGGRGSLEQGQASEIACRHVDTSVCMHVAKSDIAHPRGKRDRKWGDQAAVNVSTLERAVMSRTL